jgi:alpha-tubulin suppressor-like RCC1 family protein
MLALYKYDTYWLNNEWLYKNNYAIFKCGTNVKLFCGDENFYILNNNILSYGTKIKDEKSMCKLNTECIGNIQEIFCGDDNAFILNDKTELFCRGNNNFNKLGLTKISSDTPFTKINFNFGKIKNIIALNDVSFILSSNGKIYSTCINNSIKTSWGFNYKNKMNTEYTFNQIHIELGFIDNISCGSNFYFLTTKDKIYLFGCDWYMNKINCETFLDNNINNIKKILCSRSTAFFLLQNNEIYGIGCNSYGQLAQNDYKDKNYVVKINFNYGVINDIYCHNQGDTFIVETSDGDFYGCGENISNSLCVLDNNTEKKYCSFQKLKFNIKQNIKIDVDIDIVSINYIYI